MLARNLREECYLCYNLIEGDEMNNQDKIHQSTSMTQFTKLNRVIEKAGVIKHFRKGESIYFQDDPADCFYLIKSGRVRLFLSSEEGKELTLEILGADQMFGEASYFSRTPRLTSVDALTDVELLYVNVDILTQDHSLMMEMVAYMALRIRFLSAQVYSLTLLSSDKKAAHILIQLGTYFKEHESDIFYSIDYTHENLAKLIGIARVTMTRILRSFETKGWVSLKYRKVKVLNEAALKEFLLSS